MLASKGFHTASTRVILMTNDDVPLYELPNVEGGTIEYSTYADVRSSGSIQVRGYRDRFFWMNYRLQPIYTLDGVDYPLGVFLPTVPGDSWSDTSVNWDIELSDKLSILAGANLDASLSLPAGTNVITAVRDLIERSGERAGALTPSSETLRGDVTWDIDTNLLQCVNDLLRGAGFRPLWCDGNGQFQVTPAVSADQRPTVFTYIEGENAEFGPNIRREQDIYAIPNRVIVKSSASADAEGLVSVATNENPDSPFSFVSLGRWKDHVENGVEATSQQALDDYARLRLANLTSAIANVDIEHVFNGTTLDDVVEVIVDTAGIGHRFTVGQYSVSLDETALVKTTLREVAKI